jgi:hypothetical protein
VGLWVVLAASGCVLPKPEQKLAARQSAPEPAAKLAPASVEPVLPYENDPLAAQRDAHGKLHMPLPPALQAPRRVAYQPAAERSSPPPAQSEVLPSPKQIVRMPIETGPTSNDVQLSFARDRISLTARDVPLNIVLGMIAEQHGLNVVTGDDVSERITVKVTNVQLDDALDAILSVNGYTWARQRDIIIVSKIAAEQKSSPAVQGRQVRVFTLNYVSAADVDKVVKGLLSPVGQSWINQTAPTDHRRTHEQLVVEDMPDYLRRVEEYLAQADAPPRQVLIESHVLQVTLKDNWRHGVNLQTLLHIANSDVTLQAAGMTTGATPSALLKIDGTDLDGLIEALKATSDTKTLASPKVAVLNGQEAHMQVGGKIGYLLTTTTQTSTLQSVNFLDVGVILKVTPLITEDGQVLMQVNPQVSTGRINTTTQLPESETTEVETRVMLADGEAIVIGGLIKETDTNNQSKVPFLGDLWLVGWIFQRREVVRERNEIIITLRPRIISDVPGCRTIDPHQVQQAHTPLLYGPLRPVDRTAFEPKLTDYNTRPRDRYKEYCPPPPAPPPHGFGPTPSFDPSMPGPPAGEPMMPPAWSEPYGEPPAAVRPTSFESRIDHPARLPSPVPSR